MKEHAYRISQRMSLAGLLIAVICSASLSAIAADERGPVSKELSQRPNVLLLVGDDLEDFVAGSRSSPKVRNALVEEHASRWGKQWIVLPNPMYGAWDTSLYGHDYELSREEELDIKLEHLEQ